MGIVRSAQAAAQEPPPSESSATARAPGLPVNAALNDNLFPNGAEAKLRDPYRVAATKSEAASPKGPPYKSLRYDEEYRYLSDPGRQADVWDTVKYLPFGDRQEQYFSIGGELRERYEFYHNENFGDAPADTHGNNGYLLQRYLLHGDLHLGPHFRFFGQFMSSLEDRRIGGPRPEVNENVFDAHQAFVDLKKSFGEKGSATWRVGRQEFEYGSGRLIAAREAPNTRRSFDAARLLVRTGEWAVDGFWSKPVRNEFDAFDDEPDARRSLWGFYAVHPWAALPDGHTDLYYLGFENHQGVFNQGTAYELRHTLGSRLWGKPLPWEYNLEFIWQFGKFGEGDIQAWAVASDTHYNFGVRPLRPRLGLRADVTSGDRNPDSPDLQTYNPLFPTGAFFNLADTVGPSNFIHVHPTLDLHFTEEFKTTLDWAFFWRTSLDDAVYSIATVPIRPGQPSRARSTGSSPAITFTWELTRHVTVLASYVHFFAGPFLKQNPPGEDLDYFTTWVTYKF